MTHLPKFLKFFVIARYTAFLWAPKRCREWQKGYVYDSHRFTSPIYASGIIMLCCQIEFIQLEHSSTEQLSDKHENEIIYRGKHKGKVTKTNWKAVKLRSMQQERSKTIDQNVNKLPYRCLQLRNNMSSNYRIFVSLQLPRHHKNIVVYRRKIEKLHYDSSGNTLWNFGMAYPLRLNVRLMLKTLLCEHFISQTSQTVRTPPTVVFLA